MTHTDDQLDEHEAELHDLLERTVNAVPVPAGLAPSALHHGRRLRTRRRVGLAAGFAASTAVAAALIVPNSLWGSASSVDPAGSPTSAGSLEPPARADWPAGWWDMPAVDMISAVQAILPDGVVVTSPGPLIANTLDGGGAATGYIAPRLSGPTGPGQLHVALSPAVDFWAYAACGSCHGGTGDPSTEVQNPDAAEPPLPGGGDLFCADNLSTRVQCEELHASDGTLIGRRSALTFGRVTRLEVVLRRDGGTIYAAAANRLDPAPGQQSSGVSSEQPPLTLDQLEDLVRNDTWVMPAT